jgi:ABC-type branched-subunit amino acid transport system substrate-binding protein
MVSRRLVLQSGAAAAALFASGVRTAWAANAPGVTDTEIKIGQTMPYSGPASAYGVNGRTEVAYCRMTNEKGGINGRKINLISLDDSLSPSKTVEQTRRLVEQEQVAFIFGNPGTASNAAIRSYLNDNKVPQLFVACLAIRNIIRGRSVYIRTTGAKRATTPSTSSAPTPTRRLLCSIKKSRSTIIRSGSETVSAPITLR